MMQVRLLSTFVITLLIGITAQAQEYYQLKNRWKPTEYIHVEQPNPSAGAIQQGWWSAQWILEPIAGTSFYQIKNRWRNQYLHIENGPIACSDIKPGWWSAQWSFESVPGTSFVRIRNRWKPNVALHNQNGRLEAGQVETGWWSAQWERVSVRNDQPQAAQQPVARQPVQRTQPTKAAPAVSNKRSNNPGAFSPEHNGRISQASVRYTDQIQIPPNMNVRVGNRIYFFPQEVVVNRDGLSFDYKNPPIGGQTFTVVETNPRLVLDRPMPMMRNRVNDYIGLVIEIY